MTLLFAIRDDDVCYHTDPQILKNIYDDISKICPISFSCIPFIGGFDVDSYDDEQWSKYDKSWIKWQTKKIYPIGKNKKLVKFLKEWCHEQRATIMLHGINHDLNEFTQIKDFNKIIYEGKSYLEKVFLKKIKVASAPNNSLNSLSSSALAKNKFNILTSFGHLPNERQMTFSNIKNFITLFILFLKFRRRIRLTKPLNFKSHLEQPCYGIGPNIDFKEVMEGLKYAIKRGGNFVVASHYYQLSSDKNLLDNLIELINYAKQQTYREVKFVKAEDLFQEYI